MKSITFLVLLLTLPSLLLNAMELIKIEKKIDQWDEILSQKKEPIYVLTSEDKNELEGIGVTKVIIHIYLLAAIPLLP